MAVNHQICQVFYYQSFCQTVIPTIGWHICCQHVVMSQKYTINSPVAVPSLVMTVITISVGKGLVSTMVYINDSWCSKICNDDLLKHTLDAKSK